jgi:hypothetical protein
LPSFSTGMMIESFDMVAMISFNGCRRCHKAAPYWMAGADPARTHQALAVAGPGAARTTV